MRQLVVLVIAVAVGCSSSLAVGPLPVHPNRELAILREGASQPNAATFTILALYGLYAASHRDYEGYLFFQQRAKAEPAQPLYLALEGVFQARVANDVALLRRVAWVDDAIAKLDRAVLADPVLSRFLRGVVLAELPSRFHKEQAAIDDLQWFLSQQDKFPYGLRRPVYRALAKAYTTQGKSAEARDALAKSMYPSLNPALAQLTTDTLVSQRDGVRFGEPKLVEPVPGVVVAQGYGFSDFAFVITATGVVAIDTGSADDQATAALAALRAKTDKPITHVVLTHAHYDHIGGLGAFRRAFPGLRVIAHAAFASEVAVQNTSGVPYRSFRGEAPATIALHPDELVGATKPADIGGVRLVLHPLRGGETDDTLIVELPDRHVVFAGDVLMPYVGAPFFPEGSATGLLDALAVLRSLKPVVLIHGHTAMTERWPVESLEGLELALHETYEHVIAGLGRARTVSDLLDDDLFPAALRAHPRAVIPYVATREGFIRRLHRDHTGYWSAEPSSTEPVGDRAWASALDAIAGHDAGKLAAAARTLIARRDFVLALRVTQLGLVGHPNHRSLHELEQQALTRLREQNEQINPFKFIVYTELAGVEVLPVR